MLAYIPYMDPMGEGNLLLGHSKVLFVGVPYANPSINLQHGSRQHGLQNAETRQRVDLDQNCISENEMA